MFGRRTNSDTPAADNGNTRSAKGVAGEHDDGQDESVLWSPGKTSARKSVESLLLERGQITDSHVVQARQVAAQTPGKTTAQILLSMNAATEPQILAAVAET